MSDRGYKRSWKNLLINKRYQLRFTLFMVGLAAVLMSLLGWWVVRVADEATTVAQSSKRGEACPLMPKMDELSLAPAPAPSAPLVEPAAVPGAPLTDDSADPDDPDGVTRRRAVVIEESTIKMAPTPPPRAAVPADFVQRIVASQECELRRQAKIDEIGAGKRRILYVMIASGVLLSLGLAVFGIKMTHRVAGPLYKVTLYLAKMRDGRYDKVYDLRRGDQLVEFYEHFKHAHAGVVAMEQADVERIKAALDAAEADGVAARSDDAKAALAALREVLVRKEKSLG